MRTKVFIDSSFWIALIDKSDALHIQAANLINNPKWSNWIFFTSDSVLSECLTRLKKKINSKAAETFYRFIHQYQIKNILTVYHSDESIFKKAYAIFRSNPLSTFTFTDASNVAFMKTRKIHWLITFDQDFRKIKPKVKVLPS